MEFIIDNWYLILAGVAAVAAVILLVVKFFKLAPKEQLDRVKKWLLWAVTVAESELGGGTGQLKLRKVYDMFISKFPWVSKLISFEKFSQLVDEALGEMREMLEENEALAEKVRSVEEWI